MKYVIANTQVSGSLAAHDFAADFGDVLGEGVDEVRVQVIRVFIQRPDRSVCNNILLLLSGRADLGIIINDSPGS